MPAAFVPGAAFYKGNVKAYRRVALQLVGSAVAVQIRQTSSRPLIWLSSQRRNENEMPRPFVRGSQQFLARHRHEESDMQFPYSTGKALHANESLSGDVWENPKHTFNGHAETTEAAGWSFFHSVLAETLVPLGS
jgi:hypothetical protein